MASGDVPTKCLTEHQGTPEKPPNEVSCINIVYTVDSVDLDSDSDSSVNCKGRAG